MPETKQQKREAVAEQLRLIRTLIGMGRTEAAMRLCTELIMRLEEERK